MSKKRYLLSFIHINIDLSYRCEVCTPRPRNDDSSECLSHVIFRHY